MDYQQVSGKWCVFEDDQWYDGVLYYNTDERILYLEITICEKEDKFGIPKLSYIGKVPYVNGILSNGAKILFLATVVNKITKLIAKRTKNGTIKSKNINTDMPVMMQKKIFSTVYRGTGLRSMSRK